MSEKEIKSWVGDQLHGLLGYSDGVVAAFIVTTAKKHTNASSLAQALQKQGLPVGPRTQQFAEELLGRLPRSGPSTNTAAAEEARRTKELLKKNRTLGLLDEPATAPAPVQVPAPAPKEGRKYRDKSKSSTALDGDDDGGVRLPTSRSSKRAWEEDEDDDDGETAEARAERLAEAARLKDQKVSSCREIRVVKMTMESRVNGCRGCGSQSHVSQQSVLFCCNVSFGLHRRRRSLRRGCGSVMSSAHARWQRSRTS